MTLLLTNSKEITKRNYDFLIKASDSFKDAIFKLCKRIIEEETVPEKFRETTLHQIWKRKPGTKKEDLEANRFIHCKEWLPRAVESLVVSEMEPNIRNATSKFQIGRVAGHRPQEHLFSLKSVIHKYETKKKLLIFFSNDVSKFLDKKVLSDCMQELASAGVDQKPYRLFFKLNEATTIRVRTGCGYSKWEEAGDLLGQGSGGAAKVSVLNLDKKIALMFEGGCEMARYGGILQLSR